MNGSGVIICSHMIIKDKRGVSRREEKRIIHHDGAGSEEKFDRIVEEPGTCLKFPSAFRIAAS